MPLTVSLLVLVNEDADQEVPRLVPWLAAGWPQQRINEQQLYVEGESGYQALRQLISGVTDSSAPSVAELTAAMDGLAANRKRWRADPVSVIPDRDQLMVIPGKLANLSMAEAKILVALLNGHFHQDFQLEIGAPHRWYLTPGEPLAITTSTLDAVGGGSAGHYQAVGPDAMRLQQWLNEIQMALFGVPGNDAREACDELLVNSLWIWGNNGPDNDARASESHQQPAESTPAIPPDLVVADSGWAMALAEHYQVPLVPLPKPGEWLNLLPPSGHLVIDLARVDGDRLSDDVEVQSCCEQLQPMIGRQIAEVNIYAIERGGWYQRRWQSRDFGFFGRLLARLRTTGGQPPGNSRR